MKYSSLLSYMLKPPYLLTHGFNKNKKAQENLFNHMYNFGTHEEWRNGRRAVSSYLDVEISNDHYPLVNPTPLEYITGYTMGYAIDDRALNRLSQKSMNIIDGSTSSYCSIINSPERLHMIKKVNELASVQCNIESDRLGAKEERKKRDTEAEDQRKKKSEKKQMRDDNERLKGLETYEFLVRSVLEFGMDHINNLKVKYIRVLLHYHFGSEKLKGIPKKVELVEAVKYF